MDDQAGRILSLESSLTDLQRSVTAHDLLLRALLTHLAMSDPKAFRGVIEGFAQSGFFGPRRLTGELTQEVSEILSGMFEEIALRVGGRG
jgi:hypothetical protein